MLDVNGDSLLETFAIDLSQLSQEEYLVAFDLYTGRSFAPYSHNAANAPSPVPEPATLLLFGAGLAGLSSLRKRFQK